MDQAVLHISQTIDCIEIWGIYKSTSQTRYYAPQIIILLKDASDFWKYYFHEMM